MRFDFFFVRLDNSTRENKTVIMMSPVKTVIGVPVKVIFLSSRCMFYLSVYKSLQSLTILALYQRYQSSFSR